jgi:putative transposase
MVRDMMLIAVERRFGAYQAPHRVEFLADSGSCQTAYETVDFAIALGLMAVEPGKVCRSGSLRLT